MSSEKRNYSRILNKVFSSKFPLAYMDRKTPDEGPNTQQPKRCGSINKNEDNNPRVNSVNNYYLIEARALSICPMLRSLRWVFEIYAIACVIS